MKSIPYDEAMASVFRKEPELAIDLLNNILAEGSQAELLIAIRQISKAFGGIAQIAKETDLNQTQLYRTLSPNGNPTLGNLSSILKAMGLRLAVQPIR